MNNHQLQIGDTFLRISKYGHTFGVVKAISYKTVHSIDHKCQYIKPMLMSTNKVEYDMNECFKVTKQYTEEQLNKLKTLAEKLNNKANFTSFEDVKEYYKTKGEINNL